MNNKLMKFEHPKRIAELKPEETLKKLGVGDKTSIFDYGAGTGVFSIPASKITTSTVYAYDINDEMLSIIEGKIRKDNILNIVLIDKESLDENIEDISADIILMVTVYHEIDDVEKLFTYFDKILSDKGKVAVIEFHPITSSMGPPLSKRISKETLKENFAQRGYESAAEFHLGYNFYLISFIAN